MTPVFYFAYGSNMANTRLEERVGSIQCCGKATLKNYVIRFNKKGSDGSGKANIAKKENSSVEGVLFQLSMKQLKKLDRFEGVALKHYKREQINVTNATGKTQKVFAYIACAKHTKKGLSPTDEYLNHILDGAKEHMLSRKMTAQIENAAFKEKR